MSSRRFLLVLLASFQIFICFATAQNILQEDAVVAISKNTFLTKMLAKPLIEDRCEKYEKSNLLKEITKTFIDPLIQFNCEKVASDLFVILDIQILSDNQGYLVRALFTSKLIHLISKTTSQNILTKILADFETAELSSSAKKFDLYQTLTQKPLSLSSSTALEFIAVMFQDTNALQHIYFLEILKNNERWNNTSIKSINLDLLKKISFKLQTQFYDFQALGKNRYFKQFSFYPVTNPGITGAKSQPALYHFYTPAYLSTQLLLRNHDTYYAFIAPFALRVIYEQLFNQEVPLNNFELYLVAVGQKNPPITTSYKHVDLYLSLSGIYWALSKKLDIPFDEFTRSITSDVSKTLRLIIKKL